VALGYLNQPTLTEERFVRIDGQRFYRTGDMGRAASDGDIEFLGRDDFQIKLRGIRIELGEIEATLRQVAGVREAVVVERTLPTQEKGLVAYLVLSDTLAPAIKQVRAHLQARLPDYMVPSAFIVLEALPVNVNQKLDRRALPAPTPKDFELDRAIVLPRTELERDLARIWEDLLKISPIGVQDSFFDLGGESLMACAVMTKIEQQFGRTLPLSTLLSEPTIEHLARLLETGADGHCEPVLLRPGTSHTPIFLIHDGDGEILPYRNLAFLLPAGHSVYGIPPLSRAGYPLLQTRIADLVERYTAQILQLQPQGPYLLGGLCFGGFLAFEVAQELTRRGHRIDLLVLIDAAHVKAPPRSGVDNRLARLMAAGRTATPLTLRLFTLAIRVPGKMYNFAAYMTRSRLEQLKTRIRLRLLRICLDHKWPLPRMLRNIPVQTTLKFAESDYVEGALYRGSVLLLLASGVHADGVAVTEFDDRPMTANFAEPTMGWTSRAADLKVHDVPGGHGTMLQEPNVRVAAEVVAPYINEKSSSPSPPRNAETHEQMALAE
jgi:thioesterase domain-containing protein/acyl carrier protein